MRVYPNMRSISTGMLPTSHLTEAFGPPAFERRPGVREDRTLLCGKVILKQQGRFHGDKHLGRIKQCVHMGDLI